MIRPTAANPIGTYIRTPVAAKTIPTNSSAMPHKDFNIAINRF